MDYSKVKKWYGLITSIPFFSFDACGTRIMIESEIVIAGCGNPLYADDGFGPAVIELLKKNPLPTGIMAIDAGICGPVLLFPFLDPAVTKKLIIIDIADFGIEPGSVLCMKREKGGIDGIRDSVPGGIVESIRELPDQIEITLIGCQPKYVSHPVMEIGLSCEVQKATHRVVRILLQSILGECGTRSLCPSGYAVVHNETTLYRM